MRRLTVIGCRVKSFRIRFDARPPLEVCWASSLMASQYTILSSLARLLFSLCCGVVVLLNVSLMVVTVLRCDRGNVTALLRGVQDLQMAERKLALAGEQNASELTMMHICRAGFVRPWFAGNPFFIMSHLRLPA